MEEVISLHWQACGEVGERPVGKSEEIEGQDGLEPLGSSSKWSGMALRQPEAIPAPPISQANHVQHMSLLEELLATTDWLIRIESRINQL